MDYGTILILQYLIVVPTAIYAFFYMPERGTLAVPLENMRRNSVIFGLLPCGVLSIVLALAGTGIYYLVVQQKLTKQAELATRVGKPSTSIAGPNPFADPPRQPTTNVASGNPFADAPIQPTTNFGSGNPFSGDAGPRPQQGRNPNEPNPFS